MDMDAIQEKLFALQDLNYRQFQAKLMPTVDPEQIIGVRMPALRKLAKELMQRVVREQKQTLVMVTHDNYLAGFADRIFHIIDGQIVQVDDNRKRMPAEG